MTTAAHPKPPAGRRQTKPTWEQLTRREPRLAALLAEIRAIRPGKGFCAHVLWFGYHDPEGGYKEAMSRLVGWDSDDRLLGTQEAFEVCYDVLYSSLPDCKHPGPFC